MAIMTITIDAKTEEIFRRQAAARFGTKKGAIGKAIDEAMKEWAVRHDTETKCLELLRKSVKRGGLGYTKREELYDRN